MRMIQIAAPAKINLSLDVVKRLPNGYHEMDMMMQEIELADQIRLEYREQGIHLTCNIPELPVNDENIAVRAAKALLPYGKKEKGVAIHLEKMIPHGAGLGGGSADAAAVLKGLNELWELNLTQQQLIRIGAVIGADVPFCIFGGTARAKGIGERLRRISDQPSLPILLINPGIHVSTKEVFEALDANRVIPHPETELAIRAWKEQDFETMRKAAGNRLREVTVLWHPEIQEIEEKLIRGGAVFAMMSGSGPTVFGIYRTEEARDRAFEQVKEQYPIVIRSKTARRRDFYVED